MRWLLAGLHILVALCIVCLAALAGALVYYLACLPDKAAPITAVLTLYLAVAAFVAIIGSYVANWDSHAPAVVVAIVRFQGQDTKHEDWSLIRATIKNSGLGPAFDVVIDARQNDDYGSNTVSVLAKEEGFGVESIEDLECGSKAVTRPLKLKDGRPRPTERPKLGAFRVRYRDAHGRSYETVTVPVENRYVYHKAPGFLESVAAILWKKHVFAEPEITHRDSKGA